jgi:tRNA A-37 threonylcarbamoyl transferase component Bud32
MVVSQEYEALAAEHGLVDAKAFDALLASSARVPGGRGENYLIDKPHWGETLRVRPSRHGGWFARLLGDRFLRPDRVLHEFEIWTELHARGVPLPRPALAMSRRRGAFWRSRLLSVERPQARDGARWLESHPSEAEIASACLALAHAVRRLHDAGAIHGDLHLRNVLFEPGTGRADLRVWLIDLDSTRLTGRVSPADRLREWMRFARSLEKAGYGHLLTPRFRARLLGAYCAGDRRLRRNLLQSSAREVRRIARHRLGWKIGRGLRHGSLLAILLATAACSPDTTDGAPPPSGVGDEVVRHSLLAVGDTGRTRPFASLTEGQLSVADAMTRSAREAPVQGLVLLGDNFYWDGLNQENLIPRVRQNLVRPYCYFLRLDGPRSSEVEGACRLSPSERDPVPLFAVLGNHDLELPESADLQRHTLPEFLPDWQMADDLAQVFELGAGISLILFESEPSIRDSEAIGRAIRSAIDQSRGPWRILAAHRPIATDDYGRRRLGGYPNSVRKALASAEKPVQLVLAAHHHNLQIFEIGPPTPLLHVGVGSGARAEPPLAQDHPDARFGRIALGFARIDLIGNGADERLSVSLIEAPRWPILSTFTSPKRVARFEVDLAGRVIDLGSSPAPPSIPSTPSTPSAQTGPSATSAPARSLD